MPSWFYVDLHGFACDRALSDVDVTACAHRLGVVTFAAEGARFAMAQPSWMVLRRAASDALRAFHATNPHLQGMPCECLRLSLTPRLPANVFTVALRNLVASGEVVLAGVWARLPTHQARFTVAEDRLWNRLRPSLVGKARFRPRVCGPRGHVACA